MNITKYISLVMLVLIGFTSCKTLQTDATIKKQPLPDSFAKGQDTASIAQLNWKEYFNDPFLTVLIDTALNNNHDLMIAWQKLELSRAGVKFAKGALAPQIQGVVNGGVRRFGRYTMDGAGNISTEMTPGKIVPVNLPDMNLGFQSTWEIDVWGKLKNRKKGAVARFLASTEGVRAVTSGLIASVASSYFDLLALDHELEIVQQTIQKQKEALEAIKLQKEAGRTNELAVQQCQAQMLDLEAMERELRQRVTEVENAINFLCGRLPQKIERNKELLFNASPQPLRAGIPAQLLENRPDIREAELLLQASNFDVKVAKAAFMPGLNLTSGIGYQAFKPEYLFMTPASITYTAIGGLVAPLVNQSALKAQFNAAKADQIAAMQVYQQRILNAYTEVVNQLAMLDNLKDLERLKKEQNEVLTNSLDISSELFNTGRASYLEMLLTQQNALKVKMDLIDVNKRQQIATVHIYQTLGGGWN